MKNRMTGSILLLLLGLAVNSQAVLIDDFDGLFVGSINGQGGWSGTAPLTSTQNGQVSDDPFDGFPDKVATVRGSASGARGVYKSLGGIPVMSQRRLFHGRAHADL